MENKELTKQQIVSMLSKSPHGKLGEYEPVAKQAVEMDGEFYQHLIAWDRLKGQILDSKAALPVLGLKYEKDKELLDNSFAHLALLNPRELLKAYEFARVVRPTGQIQNLDKMVQTYLHEKEQERGWDHLAVQHGRVLKSLYAYSRTLPTRDHVHAVLWGYKGRGDKKVKLSVPKGSVFEALSQLRQMEPVQAAGTILKFRMPFLIAFQRLGKRAKEPDLLLALMERMTATELVGNTKLLEKLGMKTNPALRGAYDAAVTKATSSTKNTLKTTAAINAENADGTAVLSESTREKLRGLQEKQIAAAGGPDGDWLVLVDRSPSMARAIEFGKHIAASLAKFIKGKVWMVFFDSTPLTVDVSGLSLDQIQKATRHIGIGGGTSIGCGLNRMLLEKTEVDGIAIVSDGEENTAPLFPDVYKKYVQFTGKDVPVYFYDCDGGADNLTHRMNMAGIEMQRFDLRHGKADYYAIPNLVQTMRSNPYSLTDEIMAVPLLTLNDVLKTHGRKGVAA
jgi:hypothetical protein